jgi:predicted RNA-binding Zn ribbon-like protein
MYFHPLSSSLARSCVSTRVMLNSSTPRARGFLKIFGTRYDSGSRYQRQYSEVSARARTVLRLLSLNFQSNADLRSSIQCNIAKAANQLLAPLTTTSLRSPATDPC